MKTLIQYINEGEKSLAVQAFNLICKQYVTSGKSVEETKNMIIEIFDLLWKENGVSDAVEPAIKELYEDHFV